MAPIVYWPSEVKVYLFNPCLLVVAVKIPLFSLDYSLASATFVRNTTKWGAGDRKDASMRVPLVACH
jgi:hypothetical protein